MRVRRRVISRSQSPLKVSEKTKEEISSLQNQVSTLQQENDNLISGLEGTFTKENPNLHIGYTEKSNVDTAFEIQQLMQAQQMYSLNSKGISTLWRLQKIDKSILEI